MSKLDLGNTLLLAVLLGGLAFVIIYFVFVFNRLYRYRNAGDATLNQIGVALQKRLDMIEQLLGAVKGYVKHERELFEAIAKLRAGLPQSSARALDEVNRESSRLVGNLMAVAEAYPELKANETVMKLMEAIVSVENEIARQRYTYNNVVQEFNTMVDTIPSNFVARTQGMEKLTYLEFEEEAALRPDVTGITES
ncbi:MAG: LemA family protein [Candidatus Bathyarchaeota archaeon]|jgi:LemA protein